MITPIISYMYISTFGLSLDKEGIAIILCEVELEAKYKALVQGRSILESCLHLNLSEHINSEIGLGTITNLTSAKAWLQNSFLFQRVRRNPRYYAIGKDVGQSWEERVEEMVRDSVDLLKETQLVEEDEERGGERRLSSTGFGDIMSKVNIHSVRHSRILTYGIVLHSTVDGLAWLCSYSIPH